MNLSEFLLRNSDQRWVFNGEIVSVQERSAAGGIRVWGRGSTALSPVLHFLTQNVPHCKIQDRDALSDLVALVLKVRERTAGYLHSSWTMQWLSAHGNVQQALTEFEQAAYRKLYLELTKVDIPQPKEEQQQRMDRMYNYCTSLAPSCEEMEQFDTDLQAIDDNHGSILEKMVQKGFPAAYYQKYLKSKDVNCLLFSAQQGFCPARRGLEEAFSLVYPTIVDERLTDEERSRWADAGLPQAMFYVAKQGAVHEPQYARRLFATLAADAEVGRKLRFEAAEQFGEMILGTIDAEHPEKSLLYQAAARQGLQAQLLARYNLVKNALTKAENYIFAAAFACEHGLVQAEKQPSEARTLFAQLWAGNAFNTDDVNFELAHNYAEAFSCYCQLAALGYSQAYYQALRMVELGVYEDKGAYATLEVLKSDVFTYSLLHYRQAEHVYFTNGEPNKALSLYINAAEEGSVEGMARLRDNVKYEVYSKKSIPNFEKYMATLHESSESVKKELSNKAGLAETSEVTVSQAFDTIARVLFVGVPVMTDTERKHIITLGKVLYSDSPGRRQNKAVIAIAQALSQTVNPSQTQLEEARKSICSQE